jgi:hypothetical protein
MTTAAQQDCNYYIIVYTVNEGVEIPDNCWNGDEESPFYTVNVPADIEEDDVDDYINENYPWVGEYQCEVDPN